MNKIIPANRRAPSLLILEDEMHAAGHLARACDVLACETVVCTNLPDFLRAVQDPAHDFTGFIVDIDLGETQQQGGLDALEIIRARGINTWTAVFTAHVGRYDRMATALGANFITTKSSDLETDATALLQRWLSETSARTSLYQQPLQLLPDPKILLGVNEGLIRHLTRHPALLHQLEPRQFEELVAELWHQFGYQVQLTPRTRDGGKDIYAAKHDLHGDVLYVIECKRYGPDNPVGVELVRSLYGVAESERATAGILATTSYFTGPAKEFQKLIPYRLSLHDYDGLQEWLRQYERLSGPNKR